MKKKTFISSDRFKLKYTVFKLCLLFIAGLVIGLMWGLKPTSITRAATLTVCASGCDYTTIQAAIDATSPGDTITVGAGVYNENIALKDKIILLGAGPHLTTIAGHDMGGSNRGVIKGAQGATVAGFTIANDGSGSSYGYFSADISFAITMTFRNNAFTGHYVGVHTGQTDPLNIINNVFMNNNRGIMFGWDNTPVIRNNIIAYNGFGIQYYNNSNGDFTPQADIDYNDVWNNAANYKAYGGKPITPGPNDISADPLFVNTSLGDYRLTPCSPAIDVGDPASVFSIEPAPNGGRINMGAYGNTDQATSANCSEANWAEQGLRGAATGDDSRRLLVSSNGDVYLCPSEGNYGPYKWDADKTAWYPVITATGGCHDIAIDNFNARLYRLGGGAGTKRHIYRSNNDGLTWTEILTPAFPEFAQALAVAPTLTGTVYGGVNVSNCTNGRAYRSMNGGDAWQQAQLAPNGSPLLNSIDQCIEDIAVDPTSPNRVYLVASGGPDSSHGIYYSTDSGLTFTRMVTPSSSNDMGQVNVNVNSTVFATYDDKLWRSTNQGSTWTDITAPGGDGSVTFHPTLSDTLFVWGHRSDDEGDNWSQWQNGFFDSPAIDPTNPITWYSGTFPGVWRSLDGGNNWSVINDGLAEVNINRIAIPPTITDTYWVVAPGIGIGYTKNGGNSWTFPVVIGNDILGGADVALDPGDPDTVYAARSKQVSKSVNGGLNWSSSQVIPASKDKAKGNHLAIDPTNPQTIYFAADSWDGQWGAVYKSTNGGTNWLTTTLQNIPVVSLLIVTDTLTTTVYAGTLLTDTNATAGLYSSLDGGNTWTHLGLSESEVVDLEVDPRNPLHLYAGAGGNISDQKDKTKRGVYKSTDGGSSWNRLDVITENDINNEEGRAFDIAIDPLNPDTVYAIIWMNIYRSTDAGQTWETYYEHDWQNPTQGRPWVLNIGQLPTVGGSALGGKVNVQATVSQSILYLGSNRGLYSQIVTSSTEQNVYLPIILKNNGAGGPGGGNTGGGPGDG